MRHHVKSLCVILLVFMTMATAKAEAAFQGIMVYIHTDLQSYDQAPVIENNRTLVPMRGIFESLGASVRWEGSTKTIKATKDNRVIELTIGEREVKINGATQLLDVPPKMINNRTMVPLRFIGEALGYEVKWEQSIKTVFIGTAEVDRKVIIERYQLLLDFLNRVDDFEIINDFNIEDQESAGTLFQ